MSYTPSGWPLSSLSNDVYRLSLRTLQAELTALKFVYGRFVGSVVDHNANVAECRLP